MKVKSHVLLLSRENCLAINVYLRRQRFDRPGSSRDDSDSDQEIPGCAYKVNHSLNL